jgi:predicted esterase
LGVERSLLAILVLLPAILSCAGGDPRRRADEFAASAGLTRSEIRTTPFRLVAYARIQDFAQPMHVYIEGDGLAWLSRTRLSPDPTPRRAQGLELAAVDPAPNVAYLARPCQFIDPARGFCNSAHWSDRRFAEEVIRAMNEAIDTLVAPAPDRGIHLIGYSGGAAVAVLVADRRNDVISLRTVAGNLAVEAVNRHHRVTSMPESLDPIAVAAHLAQLPQVHFVGTRDAVVPPFVAETFAAGTGDASCVRIVEVPGVTHDSGWTDRWRDLLRVHSACAPAVTESVCCAAQ